MPLTKLGILEEQGTYRCMISCEWKEMQQTDHLVNKLHPLRCCESQKSVLHAFLKKCRFLVHWIAARLLTASAYGKSLMQLSLLSREIQSEPVPAMDR